MKKEKLVDKSNLGAYLLPGRIKNPNDGIYQATKSEELGLGTLWLSERWGNKDLGAIFGAVTQAAPSAYIAAGTTHFLTRHPIVLASMAMTLQSLSKEKFILGIGRGVAEMFQPIGLPNISFEYLIDCVRIHKKLCNGELVNYDGKIGKYTDMQLKDLPDVKQPPIILGAIGPKALKIAGTYFDGAILHPFLTPDGVNRCCKIVKDAASKAGRDPNKVKIYATVVLASDLSRDKEEEIVGGRAVSYFQNKNYADILVNFNGWDNNILRKLWDHPLLSNLKSSADQTFTNKELVEVSRILPREWLLSGAALGTNEHCASRLREYLSSGANHIIIHGSTPDQLASTIECFSS